MAYVHPLRAHGRGYQMYRLRVRPWAIIRDIEGFIDPDTMEYLTFAAWQDRTLRQVLADARWLTVAATWLAQNSHRVWASTGLDDWGDFVEDVTYPSHSRRPSREPAAWQAVEVLHRAYAYWHWSHPDRFHCQPFPASVLERRSWVRRVLSVMDYDL